MKTIEIIQKLTDEMAVLSVLAEEIPLPYKTIIDNKILGFNLYLCKVLTIETESKNFVSDSETKLENQTFSKA